MLDQYNSNSLTAKSDRHFMVNVFIKKIKVF